MLGSKALIVVSVILRWLWPAVGATLVAPTILAETAIMAGSNFISQSFRVFSYSSGQMT